MTKREEVQGLVLRKWGSSLHPCIRPPTTPCLPRKPSATVAFIVEVTMTVPGAIDVIRELTAPKSRRSGGSRHVFRVETARRCLDVGASFLTAPGLDLEIVNFALRRGVVVFPGSLDAYRDHGRLGRPDPIFVKVYPCRGERRPQLQCGL